MALTTHPGPAPGHPPPWGPTGRPDEPPRASWWSITAVLATVIVGAVLVVSASDDSDVVGLMTSIVVGVGIGALIANLTPVGRWFRRWSAIPVALVLYLGLTILIAFLASGSDGGGDGSGTNVLGYLFVGFFFVLASLDLCYVSRLRVMVVLTGLCVLPVVAALGSTAVFSAFAWFAAAAVSFWVLSLDEQRAIARPEPLQGPSTAPAARPTDLIRIVAIAVLAGFTLAFLLSTPSCSLNTGPLARMFDWIPWHPQVEPSWNPGVGEPVVLHELDDEGRELSTYVDVRGRRFIVDPRTNEAYAVMDRDGTTVVQDGFGAEVARFEDGGLVAVAPGDEVRYERDDRWFLETDDGERWEVLVSGTVGLSRPGPDGTEFVMASELRPDEVGVTWREDGLGRLDADDDGFVPIPNRAILDATTGTGAEPNRTVREGGATTIVEPGGDRRTFTDDADGVTVDVEPAGTDPFRHSYRLDRDSDVLTAHDEDGTQVVSIRIDREGNALEGIDGVEGELPEPPEPDDGGRPSPPWRTLAIVVAVLAAIGAGVAWYVWWRRRDDGETEDRDWAEQQVRRLESWGRDHTFPRESAESIVRYATRLDHEVARDGSLPGLADVLDGALFGGRPVPPDRRLQVEATLDRLIEEHPKPGRAERLRGGPDHGSDREPVG